MSLLQEKRTLCRKKAATTEQANVVMNKETVGEEEDSQQYGPMFHVNSGSSKPLMVKVVVNGKLLAMELGTGASASIVSEETFEQIREGQTSLELQKSAVKLQTYTGESIGVVGSTPVQVEHNGQTASLSLIVTQGRTDLPWQRLDVCLEVGLAGDFQGQDHSHSPGST